MNNVGDQRLVISGDPGVLFRTAVCVRVCGRVCVKAKRIERGAMRTAAAANTPSTENHLLCWLQRTNTHIHTHTHYPILSPANTHHIGCRQTLSIYNVCVIQNPQTTWNLNHHPKAYYQARINSVLMVLYCVHTHICSAGSCLSRKKWLFFCVLALLREPPESYSGDKYCG